MRKVQRNNLVEAIQSVGIDPLDFELEEYDDVNKVHIKHRHTSSWFTVCFEGGLLQGKYVVGDNPEWPVTHSTTWHYMLPKIITWLSEVKNDLETPDKWTELQKRVQVLSIASDSITDNTPFTSDEQKQIEYQLQMMVERAQRTYSLSPAQVKAFNDKLEYVVKASRRLGRKNWFLLFAGAILSYLPMLLPAEAIRDMFLSLLKAIDHLHGFSDLSLLP